MTTPASDEKEKKSKVDGFFRAVRKFMWGVFVTLLIPVIMVVAIFNANVRQWIMQRLRGLGILSVRLFGHTVHEVLEAAVHGVIVVFWKYVGLVLLNIYLHVFMTKEWWDWRHFAFNFIYVLIAEHLQLIYMAKRLAFWVPVSGLVAFLISFKLNGQMWETKEAAIRNALGEMTETGWSIIRRLQSESKYFIVCALLGMFVPWKATGIPWILLLPATLGLLIWKMSLSLGNNLTADAGHVIDGTQYDVLRREKGDDGILVWKVGKGRKFKPTGFHAWTQVAALSVIFASCVYAWSCFFYYGSDRDHDGLTYIEEKIVWGTDPLNPDSDGDGIWDGKEVHERLDPGMPIGSDPWAGRFRARKQEINNRKMDLKEMEEDRRLREDSLRVIGAASTSGSYLPPCLGKDDLTIHNLTKKLERAGRSPKWTMPLALILVGALVWFAVMVSQHIAGGMFATLGAALVIVVIGVLLSALGWPFAMLTLLLGAALVIGLVTKSHAGLAALAGLLAASLIVMDLSANWTYGAVYWTPAVVASVVLGILFVIGLAFSSFQPSAARSN